MALSFKSISKKFYITLLITLLSQVNLFSADEKPSSSSRNIGDELKADIGIEYTWKVSEEENYLINVQIENNNFILYFLDKNRKIIYPPVDGASIRYENAKGSSKKNVAHLSINDNGTCLVSSRFIHKPYLYWVNLGLYNTKTGQKDQLIKFNRKHLSQ